MSLMPKIVPAALVLVSMIFQNHHQCNILLIQKNAGRQQTLEEDLSTFRHPSALANCNFRSCPRAKRISQGLWLILKICLKRTSHMKFE